MGVPQLWQAFESLNVSGYSPTTYAAPALVQSPAFVGPLYMVTANTDTGASALSLFWYTGDGGWNGGQNTITVSGLTPSTPCAPALTTFGNTLYLAWISDSGVINVASQSVSSGSIATPAGWILLGSISSPAPTAKGLGIVVWSDPGHALSDQICVYYAVGKDVAAALGTVSNGKIDWTAAKTIQDWVGNDFNPETNSAPTAGMLALEASLEPGAPTAIFPGKSGNLTWVAWNGTTFVGNETIKPKRLTSIQAAASNVMPGLAAVAGKFRLVRHVKTIEIDEAMLLYKGASSNNIMEAFYTKLKQEWYGNVNVEGQNGGGYPSTSIGVGVATFVNPSTPSLQLICAYPWSGNNEKELWVGYTFPLEAPPSQTTS